MNAPHPILAALTNLRDRYGYDILLGDIVKKYDYSAVDKNVCMDFMVGRIVFVNGAYRVKFETTYGGAKFPPDQVVKSLTQNHTLVYDQIVGTNHIEVITPLT